ncbi:4-hydroxy-tetrahydrodipicolinate synthase [Candidatus Woesearchaeota archaeon]|nr:MAG: 4-hydroxy-tetrahydrodipicolinate synthase [Candidatus Woesearchaeota archaeon]
MREKIFGGVYTAIVTPFDDNEEVDYGKLRELIEFQIDNGVEGIVPCGTTGESPTLSHDEHNRIIEETVKIVDSRVKVLAGTGSNSTREAIDMSIHAEKAGVDSVMLVNPYYNKPTQEGLFRHFTTVAKAVNIPVVIYNIKGRSSVNLETDTLIRIINEAPNVRGVKEASGDMEQIKEVISRTPDDFSVMSGDDALTFEIIRNGGDGIISVASNVIPEKVVELADASIDEDFERASELNNELQPFFEMMFIETSPIPVKATLALQGKIEEVYRLPMCELMPENKERLEVFLSERNLTGDSNEP